MPPFNRLARAAALGLAFAMLGACSKGYLDRRDTIALSAGDANASNIATQMVDPWPRESANRNIAFNGQKMQSAVERYRNNQVTPPKATSTSSTYGQSQAGTAAVPSTSSAPVGQSITQPAAAVR